jgi:ribosomal protein L44E
MMRHRYGCTGKPVMTAVTAVGPRQWFVFRCNVCGAVELRTNPRVAAQRDR